MCDRFFKLALLRQRKSQVEMCLGVIRLELQCLFVLPNLFFNPALLRQCQRQVVVYLGGIGLDPHRLVTVFDCLRNSAFIQ